MPNQQQAKRQKKQSKIMIEPYTTQFGSAAEPSKPTPAQKKQEAGSGTPSFKLLDSQDSIFGEKDSQQPKKDDVQTPTKAKGKEAAKPKQPTPTKPTEKAAPKPKEKTLTYQSRRKK